MIKVLSFADLHVGVKTYGKIDPITGLNTRELQTLDVLEDMINYAIDNKVEIIVAAGDMYKNNLPSPTLQNEFNKRIKVAADKGITCLILDGNHDVSKMNTTCSAMKTFSTLDIPNIIHTRFHQEFIYDNGNEKIKFVFLPTYHTKQEIKEIIDNTSYDGFPIVFIGHLTIKGALLNDWLIEDKEIYIDSSDFNKEGVAAVICGHLHKHQILNYSPLVYYTGSTQRIDFNEEKQEKGFVTLDIYSDCSVDYKFVESKSQMFFTLKEDLTDKDNGTSIILNKLKDNNHLFKNSIIRIIVNANENTILNNNEIYDYLSQFNPLHILDIQKVYNNVKKRNSDITENVTLDQSLELFYQGKPREKERIELGKKIIKKWSDNK